MTLIGNVGHRSPHLPCKRLQVREEFDAMNCVLLRFINKVWSGDGTVARHGCIAAQSLLHLDSSSRVSEPSLGTASRFK